jgi:hypothetical protein
MWLIASVAKNTFWHIGFPFRIYDLVALIRELCGTVVLFGLVTRTDEIIKFD